MNNLNPLVDMLKAAVLGNQAEKEKNKNMPLQDDIHSKHNTFKGCFLYKYIYDCYFKAYIYIVNV